MDSNDNRKPVPQPRRTKLNDDDGNNRQTYENVSIDMMNKVININDDNLQTNRKVKIQNDKTFMLASTSTTTTTTTTDRIINTNNNNSTESSHSSLAYGGVGVGGASNRLDRIEKNNLFDANKNVSAKNFEQSHKLNNLPVPAPRRPADHAQQQPPDDIYENNECVAQPLPPPKSMRKAPRIPTIPPPPPTSTSTLPSSSSSSSGHHNRMAKMNNDITGMAATTKPLQPHEKLTKSLSNSSLNSSNSAHSNDTATSSPKYKTTSPGELFKSLGATSKLLTESITERVSLRTKDTKHKIDKMQKTSRDLVMDTKRFATSHLKNVRRNINSIGDNLSLGRSSNHHHHQRERKVSASDSLEFDLDRPQTVPANDELFTSIAFKSPLNAKTQHCYDLVAAASDDNFYEVPKKSEPVINSTKSLYPSLEKYSENRLDNDVNWKSNFIRNANVTQSMSADSASSSMSPPQPIAAARRRSVSKQASDVDDLPVPNYPPPVYTPMAAAAPSSTDQSVYGKIQRSNKANSPIVAAAATVATTLIEPQSIRPPARTKRRKDYEDTAIIPKPMKKPEETSSTRATIDSNEFKIDLTDESISSANQSRSESWSFYDAANVTNDDDTQTIDSSTPEPIYANDDSVSSDIGTAVANRQPQPVPYDESVYGVLYDPDSTAANRSMLLPHVVMRESNECVDNAAGGVVGSTNSDIIREFDPLIWTTMDEMWSSASNELLLLENLLGQDTYGTVGGNGGTAVVTDLNESTAFDTISSDFVTPDGSDNEETAVSVAPDPPERQESLSIESDQPIRTSTHSVIIHQNTNLRSDSQEDISGIEVSGGTAAAGGPVTVDSVVTTPSRSNWFVDDDKAVASVLSSSSSKKGSKTKGDILPPNAPPSYSEAISEPSTLVNRQELAPASSTKPTTIKSMFSNVLTKMEGIGIKRKASFNKGSTTSTSGRKQSIDALQVPIEMIARPSMTNRLILHEGNLIRLPSGSVVDDILKDQHMRKAFIRESKFQAYQDKELKVAKENFPLDQITTIQCVSKHNFTNNSMELHCFEITTSSGVTKESSSISAAGAQRVCHLYGVTKESDRYIWMQKLLESVTDVFPTGYTCKFYRAGWCYLKNSITSQWSGAWVLLQKQKKRLICYNTADGNLQCMDLRKARCLVLKESDESIKNLHVESGPMLMIDCPPFSMYMIMSSPRETKVWRHILREVAHNNGPALKEQQLTKDDVPVLVDKCINFVYAHGSMSEGIYRKSGSENAIQKLLNIFRVDAFAVQITRTEYNEHDVANALKRFMRDLPDRLLGKYSASFVAVAAMKSKTEKIAAYKELLQRLPSIEYHTLRKLIGHLNFIQSQKIRNKMSVDNLAIVWGPTLLDNKKDVDMQFSQKDADVIIELVMLYKNLYQLTSDELAREKIMLNVLQKYHAAAENLSDSVKKSGDLKVWITLDPNPDNITEEKRQINVTLTPTKTVNDICKELAPKMSLQPFAVTLFENILNGDMRRPLHFSERVFDHVIRWSYWPEADRKHNFLQLQPIGYMRDVQRALRNLPIVSPQRELKFADCKTKSFKSYTLEIENGRLTVMKQDKNTFVKVREIDLRRATAYLGCERKRDIQMRWSITIIENDGHATILRTRESPFFGHVMAGTNSNDALVWYSSILHSLYGDDIMPNPEIIIE